MFNANFNAVSSNYSFAYDGSISPFVTIADIIDESGPIAGNEVDMLILLGSGQSVTAASDGVTVLRWNTGVSFDVDAVAYDMNAPGSFSSNGYFLAMSANSVNTTKDARVQAFSSGTSGTITNATFMVGVIADGDPKHVGIIVPANPIVSLADGLALQATGCIPSIAETRLEISAMSVSRVPTVTSGRLLAAVTLLGDRDAAVNSHPGQVTCFDSTESGRPSGEPAGDVASDPGMFAYATIVGFNTTNMDQLAHQKIVAYSNDYVRDTLNERFLLSNKAAVVIDDVFAFDDGSYAVIATWIGYMSFGLTGSTEKVVLLSNATATDDGLLPEKFALIHFDSLANGGEIRYAVEFSSSDGHLESGARIFAQADDARAGMLVGFDCNGECTVRGLFDDSVPHVVDNATMVPSGYQLVAERKASVFIVNGEPQWSLMISSAIDGDVSSPHLVALASGQGFGVAFETVLSEVNMARRFTNGTIDNVAYSPTSHAIVIATVDYDGQNPKIVERMSTNYSPGPRLDLHGLVYSDSYVRADVSVSEVALNNSVQFEFQSSTDRLRTFAHTYLVGVSVDVSVDYRDPSPSEFFGPALDLVNRPPLAPLAWPVVPTPAPPIQPGVACTSDVECSAGTRCSGDTCFPCEAGQFSPGSSYATVCNLCPPGFFQDQPGSSNCSTPCPDARTSDAGAASESECYCDDEHYDLVWEWGDYEEFNVSSTCVECPEEEVAECPRNESPYAKPGYFKFFNLTELDEDTGTPEVVYIACIPEIACSGNNTCKEGYSGVGCASCAIVPNATEDGGDQIYYRLNGNCFKCNENLNVIFLMSIAAIVFLITLYMFLRYKWILGAASIKLGISFIQLTALLGNIKNMWPPQVLFIFAVLSTINFNIEVLGPECFDKGAAEGGYFHVWLAKMIFPMVIFAVLIGLSKLFAKIGMKTVGNVMFRLLMQLLNIMYLFLATTVLQFFDCTTYRDGFAVMDASAATPCYEGEWTENLPFAIFGLLVWVMGIPIAFGVLLFNLKRHALLRDHKTLLENEYLIGHFKTRAFWWTLVDLATKIVLLMVQLFFSSQLLLQLVFSVMIMLGVIVAHVWYKPYIWSMNNRLSILLFFNLIILLLFGVIFSSSEEGLNDTLTTVLTTIIALIIGASIVSIIYTVFKETSIRRKNGGHTWTEADFLREDRKLGLTVVGEGGGAGGGIKDEPWYFSFDREEAETYLLDHPKVRFLVRPSSRFGCYTLSYLEDNKFKHSIIERTENNRFRLPPQTKEYDTVNELLVDQPSLMEAAEAAGGDHYDDVSELKKLPMTTTEVPLPKAAASPAPSARSSAVMGARTSTVAAAPAAAAASSSAGSRTSAVASAPAATEEEAQTPKEAALAQLATLAYWRPDADRKAAEAELGEAEEDVGVVRPSRKPNAFAVTYRSEGSVHHTVIECRRLGLCIVDNEGDEQIFKTFDDALSFLHVEGKV
jgi:hypothetical protein